MTSGAIALETVPRFPLIRLRSAGWRASALSPAVREVVSWWLVSRAVVLGSALAVQLLGWPGRPPSLSRHPFALLGMWDGRWYRIIAERGYLLVPGRASDTAFFPLLPILEHGLHGLGISFVLAGALVANAGFLVGLLSLYALGRQFLPEADARRAAIYAAIFPFGFVFSMAYPEGLAFAALALAGLFSLRGRWLPCAACAAAATLARPEGLFLVLPLLAIVVRRWPQLPFWQRARAATALLAAPFALAAFSGYLWLATGDPLAWSKAERAWGRSFALDGVYRAAVELLTAPAHHRTWLFRDLALGALYLALVLVALAARVPRSWVLAALLIVLLPLASGSIDSDARFGLLALPVFWGLAVAGRRTWFDRVLRIVSPALLAVCVFTIPLRHP